ncbi:MAG: CatB-related O-acetyltransferase [Moraxella sp.]|nr:CatB-related O-acetyltransferase [Moraxella sp.]
MLKRANFANCTFAKGCSLFSEFNTSFGTVDFHGLVYLGFASYMGSGYVKGKTLIRRYCSIGQNVKIALAKHPLDNFSTHPMWSTNQIKKVDMGDAKTQPSPPCKQLEDSDFDVVIESDVWIGDDCLIVKGVHIGQGATIGANSVVTKDVPPYAIVVGSPARVIRYRFSDEIIKRLMESHWWEIHPSDLKLINDRIATIEQFLIEVESVDKNFPENYLKIELEKFQ